MRQMLKKVRIENNGDSDFLPGAMVDLLDYEDEVARLTVSGSSSGSSASSSWKSSDSKFPS